MKRTLRTLRELRRYPTAVAGIAIIAGLLLVSLYAMIALPLPEALRLWRGGPGVWDETPRNAAPVWFDLFTGVRQPRTLAVDAAGAGTKTVTPLPDGRNRIEITLPFDYAFDRTPSELALFATATAEAGVRTRYTAEWRTPDGFTVPLVENRSMRATDQYFISQDARLLLVLGASPEIGLFTVANKGAPARERERQPVQGRYELVIVTEVPADADYNARLVVYGNVHGLAGTDHRRRDLTVALLWGTPIALVFGLVAAVGSSITTFILAGISTWYGRWLDAAFQRITEVNMIVPMLPVLIMVGHFYSRSLWLMLGLVILLSIFSGAMITYRAMFLQVKESSYIEAAQAYGAGNLRIVFRYLLPRIIPVLLPTFVLVIPTFVFLEAGLAFLGLGDPILPTWGKVINDAHGQDALYKGYYYWVLQPAVLLMITGFGFAMVGYALDRVFNPRLRTV